MTFGQKLRKYRLLKGMTQKALGAEVLKGKMNSDVRINQYERDFAVPKEETRAKLADALDVDLPALSDINIRSVEDMMYVLFEMEDKLGLKVSKQDGKIQLTIDHIDEDRANEMLLTYLSFWENEASKNHSTDQLQDDYYRWQGRFSSTVTNYLIEKEEAINEYYKNDVSHFATKVPYAKTTSDIARIFRKLIEGGFTISTRYTNDMSGSGYVFRVNELLNPPSEDAKMAFANFLSEIHHFNELGADCYTELSMPEDHVLITYNIPLSSMNVIRGFVDQILDFIEKDDKTEFVIDSFEQSFEKDLNTYYNNIEEEIANYVESRKLKK